MHGATQTAPLAVQSRDGQTAQAVQQLSYPHTEQPYRDPSHQLVQGQDQQPMWTELGNYIFWIFIYYVFYFIMGHTVQLKNWFIFHVHI